MRIKSCPKEITATLLALLMLTGCAQAVPPHSPGTTQPEALPQINVSQAANPEKATHKPVYSLSELTVEGIDVEAGAGYYLPMGEGKYVPAEDTVWQDYLEGQEFSALESLSMPFVGVDCGETALVYIMENPYRATVRFSCRPNLQLSLAAELSPLDPSAKNGLRVYTTENSAAAVAAVYRSYLEETRRVLTLAEKAEQNPNVAKLYGAPHIYLWGDFLLSDKDVNWQAFIKSASSPVLARVSRLLGDTEDGGQFSKTLSAIAGQEYVDNYQRRVVLGALSTALGREDFYDSAVMTVNNNRMKVLLAPGEAQLNLAERIELNKNALYESLPGVFTPVEGWYADATSEILKEMKSAGIDTAWIGLNSPEQALRTPGLGETAAENGYLLAPYDSYHSIHQPGKEQWETAKFPDTTLYETATVENQKGEKLGGFQNTGRKLNPTLALPAVKERVQSILNTGAQFSSWFVDCDATGEVFDDYSPSHPTPKQQDVAARLERMGYIAKEYGMVVGSEGGNDFAANAIAFAHGIELQSFSWMDTDMKSNKESEYYLGRYYSPNGGVPEKFAKPVPVKEKFRKLFLDMSYQIPLYKLVYNDSVITSYHWDWSTFKIIGESENRMLRELLYNVPPMYHLDRHEWDSYKERIIAHNAVWSPFSKKAINLRMTGFWQLTDDRLVQMTQYGDSLQVVANFSQSEYLHEGTPIPPRSALIIDGTDRQLYTP